MGINRVKSSDGRSDEELTPGEIHRLSLLDGSWVVRYRDVEWMALMHELPDGRMGLTLGDLSGRSGTIQCKFVLNGLGVGELVMTKGSLPDLKAFLRGFEIVKALPSLSIRREETRAGVSVTLGLAGEELK